MEVILKQDIENLGYKDDIVEVKPGYGRNFLIPQGVAVMASPGAKRMLEEDIRQRQHKEKKQIEEAEKTAEALREMEIKLTAKVGKDGKLFGSVNNADLAEELSKAGHHIDRKYIQIQGGTVRATGPYVAHIRLHREVVVDKEFEVVAEQ